MSETDSFYSRHKFLDRNAIAKEFAIEVMVGNLHEKMEPKEYADMLLHIWSLAEWPEKIIDGSIWSMLFDFADKKYLIPQDQPETITIYRGAVQSRKYGMSWTSDIEKAKWFANRFGDMFSEHVIFKVTIKRDDALAYSEERGESEWILDQYFVETLKIEEIQGD